MDANILLEERMAELEILEFTSGGQSYGMNVAKVREIVIYQPTTPVPNSHPNIEGVFMLWDRIITVLDLKNCLGKGKSEQNGFFIITTYLDSNIAFHVESVCGIHRVSYSDVMKADAAISAVNKDLVTGTIKKDGKLMILLDFEKIVTDIQHEMGLNISKKDERDVIHKIEVPLLVVVDSPLLKKLILDCLRKAGYYHFRHMDNGQEAYDWITRCKEKGMLDDSVRCIITDVEMPGMDGYRLTRLVKSDNETAHIPVVIFTSVINDEIRRKGMELGANAQLSKSEIGRLLDTVDQLVDGMHLDV